MKFHENFVVTTLNVQNFIPIIKLIFQYIVFPCMAIFQRYKKHFLSIVHTLCGSLFHAFT
jgi:hypothetical protein